MNFYLNAVDEQLRAGDDRESVGIILCADRDDSVARLALHRVYSPIAIATWQAAARPEQLPSADLPEPEVAELDTIRERLVEHVAKRAAQIDQEQA